MHRTAKLSRVTRCLVLLVTLVSLQSLTLPALLAAGPSHVGLADTSASPHVAMRSVGLVDVTWSKGFWADRFETCRTNMIPQLSRIMEGTERSQFLHNFRVAAGTADGRHRGPSFNDGDCYKSEMTVRIPLGR